MTISVQNTKQYGSISQVRLTRLCNITDTPFPVMSKEEKIDKIGKKAEKILTVNHILEVREKVPIPAGSAKLGKVRVQEN